MLVLQSLEVGYPGHGAALLAPITLRVEAGAFHCVLGRNGVGKSTLMKLAAGLLVPSQGAVRVLGYPAGSLAARARLGFCPDLDRLYEPLSGRDFRVTARLSF